VIVEESLSSARGEREEAVKDLRRRRAALKAPNVTAK
jgi:hypothetical protein